MPGTIFDQDKFSPDHCCLCGDKAERNSEFCRSCRDDLRAGRNTIAAEHWTGGIRDVPPGDQQEAS